jgi:hypothetical protein
MSTRLKVMGGTRSSLATRLCDSCERGIVRRGASDSDEEVHCIITRKQVVTRVVECSRYVDASKPSLWDMRQIAWVLQTDSRRQKIGFMKAREWEQKFSGEELLPPHLE